MQSSRYDDYYLLCTPDTEFLTIPQYSAPGRNAHHKKHAPLKNSACLGCHFFRSESAILSLNQVAILTQCGQVLDNPLPSGIFSQTQEQIPPPNFAPPSHRSSIDTTCQMHSHVRYGVFYFSRLMYSPITMTGITPSIDCAARVR